LSSNGQRGGQQYGTNKYFRNQQKTASNGFIGKLTAVLYAGKRVVDGKRKLLPDYQIAAVSPLAV
jgi:hypothetical protein